jgi:hypothetical protein
MWEMGQNSRGDGSFGLALENGSYQVFANVPGQLSNYSRSALCDVTVSGGEITTANSACVVDKKLRLALRNPNLTFKLMDGSAAVANAHVSVSVGNWYGWAQSSQNGTVSLLIDEKEIAASNPQWSSGTLPINLNVQAPYGNTSVVSWNCRSGDNKPVCSGITAVTKGQTYLSTALNLGNVQFQKPNTTLIIRNSAGAVLENAWVALYKQQPGGWRDYIGWGNTDATGKAVFNVEDETGTFGVDVDPPWNLRGAQSRKSFSGLTYAALSTTNFATAAPNLKLSVRQSQAPYNPSRWAHVWVEEVNPLNSYAYVRWVSGFGSDESGQVSMFLESNKTYRINVNPGPGSVGTRTSCIVAVDGSGVVSQVSGQCPTGGALSGTAMNIDLSSGNVFGKVRLSNSTGPSAVGAIVFAEAYQSGNAVPAVTRESIVDADGNYGLQLDPSYDWKIKVFYVNPTTTGNQYSSMLTPVDIAQSAVPTGTDRTQRDFVLAVR